MKKNNSSLVILWGAAGLSLLAGIVLTIHSLSGIARSEELLSRKTEQVVELSAMRAQAVRYQSILKLYAGYPATPRKFSDLARTALPGSALTVLSSTTQPAVPGWTAQKISVELSDITGEDIGKLLDAGTAAKPPWALVECVFFASPTPGRIAKATLVMETAERQSTPE